MMCSQWIISGGTWCWFVPLLVILTFISWLRRCLPGFSVAKLINKCFVLINKLLFNKHFVGTTLRQCTDSIPHQTLTLQFLASCFAKWWFCNSFYIYYLQFYYKVEALHLYLFVCPFIHLYQHKLMNFYFIQWAIIHNSHYLFWCSNCFSVNLKISGRHGE